MGESLLGRGVTAVAIVGAVVGMGAWAAACGGSNDTGVGVDGGADSTLPGDARTDTSRIDTGSDVTVDTGADTRVDTGADAGVDSGVDARADAGGDTGVDAGVDAPMNCVGSGGVTVNVTCPPSSTTPCDAGGACGDMGGAAYNLCTSTQCSATANGPSFECYPSSACSVGISGIDFCVACDTNATCNITDNGSAGSQAYYCGPGSDCTINVVVSSGSRIVDCSQAKSCIVNAFTSGETEVLCPPPPAPCNVNVTGGFNTVCCYTTPIQCANGSYACSPAPAGDGGAEAGDAGAEAGDGGC